MLPREHGCRGLDALARDENQHHEQRDEAGVTTKNAVSMLRRDSARWAASTGRAILRREDAAAQHDRRADEGRDNGAERVERLREQEPKMRPLVRPQIAQRVGWPRPAAP